MARPKKEGLEYFPLDVNAGIDDEIELLEAEFGLEGFAIFIKLLQKIYKSSYYLMWTEKEKLQFSKRVNVDINRVNVIIMACLKWDLFNQNLYDNYQILTSRGIQKRFLIAIDRRTSYKFYSDYLLLDVNEVNACKNLVIVSKTVDNVDINPQIESKEKEKVKESKEKVNTEVSITETHSLALEICNYYSQLKPGEFITAHLPTLKIWITNYGVEWTKESIQMCVSRKNKFIVPYIEKILMDWQANGKPQPTTSGGNYNRNKPSPWDLGNQRGIEKGLEDKLLELSAGEETDEDPREQLKKLREGGS